MLARPNHSSGSVPVSPCVSNKRTTGSTAGVSRRRGQDEDRMVSFRTPMLWTIGFIVVSTIGGLDVVALTYVRESRTLQDTYLEVGYECWHMYYVLCWAAVFGIFAVWYYFFAKITRRTYSDFLGTVHFWLSLIGAAILVPQNIVAEG